MKTKNIKTGNQKLQLKKTAVASLTLSDDKMKYLVGGAGKTTDDTSNAVNTNTNCTSFTFETK